MKVAHSALHLSLMLWERAGVRERSGARRHVIIRGGSTRPKIVRAICRKAGIERDDFIAAYDRA